MEKKSLTRDEFAVFMANIINGMDMYNYDAMYDIAKVVAADKNRRGESTVDPVMDTVLLCVRNTGCDLIEVDNPQKDLYFRNNENVYELVFCWNCDYMHRIPFCVVTTIK